MVRLLVQNALLPVVACVLIASGALAEQLRPEARPSTAPVETSVGPDAVVSEEVALAPIEAQPIAASVAPTVGPETNLPLPRYVSLKTDEGNVRRGPSLSHRIDWVFLRRDMPLQVVAEYGHWRRVIDREGVGGWVHYALLSGVRTVIVDEHLLPLRMRPSEDSPEVAELELGVIARLGECTPNWCRLTAGGYRGWAPKSALWGVGADEIRD